MADPDLIDRLASCQSLAGVPRSELEWLVARGQLAHFPAGDVVARTDQPIENLYILLSGRIGIDVDRGAGPRRIMEWGPCEITGLLPYSRLRASPGITFAQLDTDALFLHRDHLPAMIRECPVFTAKAVHVMLDRARNFNSSDLHDEKMVSLGKLTAGLAHELNNPASATVRGAKLLARSLAEADAAARALGAAGLTDEQQEQIERTRAACLAKPTAAVLSPIERADREDEFAAWLERHAADPGLAATLADTPVTLEALQTLADVVPDHADNVVLRWIAAGCAVHALALDVERAASRIHELVSIMKKFTYMDRLAGPEPVDVGGGLRDTIALVAAKARSKSVAVRSDIEPDLPPVRASGGELNQVWLNLIDNALDAAPAAGQVQITAQRELGSVVVRIIDDGPGIPPELRDRIFDPFFTTKPPGQGTGLGLDIARRLVRRYHGDIELHSQPGRTEFLVRLPVMQAAALTGTDGG